MQILGLLSGLVSHTLWSEIWSRYKPHRGVLSCQWVVCFLNVSFSNSPPLSAVYHLPCSPLSTSVARYLVPWNVGSQKYFTTSNCYLVGQASFWLSTLQMCEFEHIIYPCSLLSSSVKTGSTIVLISQLFKELSELIWVECTE